MNQKEKTLVLNSFLIPSNSTLFDLIFNQIFINFRTIFKIIYIDRTKRERVYSICKLSYKFFFPSSYHKSSSKRLISFTYVSFIFFKIIVFLSFVPTNNLPWEDHFLGVFIVNEKNWSSFYRKGMTRNRAKYVTHVEFSFSWAYATPCNAFNGILNVQVLSLITSNTR